MNLLLFAFVFLLSSCHGKTVDLNSTLRKFPDQFFFGVSTAAYQIEGAWNVADKGESIWDRLTHKSPQMVKNHENGDVACDSYNLYERDVEMLSELGVNFYRFSLSWSRILPTGFPNIVSPNGIQYYNNLINALLKKNITPLITLYHWDLPQKLQDLGGWTNPMMAEYFEDYAKVAFEQFGDRVKHWLTFNEPKNVCVQGYGETNLAPALNASGIGEYICGHTILIAHARAYHLYDQLYRSQQKGNIGITLDVYWAEPATITKDDEAAANRAIQFYLGWFAHPIFSKKGDYPSVMKNRIAFKSEEQGYARSRLPEMSKIEQDLIRGTADFLGLNHYSTVLVKKPDENTKGVEPSYYDDAYFYSYHDDSWPGSASNWLKVVPWGFRKILNWIKKEYNNPEVIITENGFSTFGGLVDNDRIFYINQYLNALLDAIDEDDCNISAYTYWSLMDNFEWLKGYSERFGLYEVNFTDKKRSRTPRDSAKYFANIIKTRSIEAYDTCIDCFDSKPSVIISNVIE